MTINTDMLGRTDLHDQLALCEAMVRDFEAKAATRSLTKEEQHDLRRVLVEQANMIAARRQRLLNDSGYFEGMRK